MRNISYPRPVPRALFCHGGIRADTGQLLDFSANLNPLGPPWQVMLSIGRELSFARILQRRKGVALTCYPDPACSALARRLARLHGVSPSQVVVGNGASELIHALPRAFRARRAAIVEPTYTEYLRASLRAGARVSHWLAEGATFRLEPFDPEGADLIWLCNPNNPTGQLWPPGTLIPWVEAYPEMLFLVDESFLPFRADEPAHTLISAVDRLPNLIVIRSLTKLYTLPGLRLGYAVASAERARRLRGQLAPWSVNALAQIAGRIALDDGPFLTQTRAWLAEELGGFTQQVQACSACLEPVPSQANFVLLRLRGVTAAWLTQRLRERGIAVRDAFNFLGLDDRYVRVALRQADDNRRLFNELRSLFQES
jgi:threonine-phosphate decarboxylase